MKKGNGWHIIATGSICLSLCTLLLPIVTYVNADGTRTAYNIFSLVFGDFTTYVFSEYTGTLWYGLPYEIIAFWVVVFVVVGIVAIMSAFRGINGMSKQYESNAPYHQAVWGCVGTAIPSLALLILYLMSADQFMGTIELGAYIVVTPIAMIFSLMAVTARHRLTQEEARLQREAAAYIRPAGDLPVVRPYGGGPYYHA